MMHSISLILLLIISNLSICQQVKNKYIDTTVIRANSDPFLIKTDSIIAKYVDFFFYNGEEDVVAFQLNENLFCKGFTIHGADSSSFCFKITEPAMDSLMEAMDFIRKQVEVQAVQVVKCDYCNTLQLFWNDGFRERSILKRAYTIPKSINLIIDFCYDKSTKKEPCNFGMSSFKCFQGYDDLFRNLAEE